MTSRLRRAELDHSIAARREIFSDARLGIILRDAELGIGA